MPKYLERRRRRWYAILDIPADVRRHFGGQRRLRKSLETESLTEAQRRVPLVIARWKAEFDEARTGKPSHLQEDMPKWMEWAGDLRKAKGEERETLQGLVTDRAQDIAWKDPEKAETFYRVVTGESLPTAYHIEAWLKDQRNESKTLFEKRRAVEWFAEDFPQTHLVTRQKVRSWAHKLTSEGDLARATVSKRLSALRGYWAYLQKIEAIPGEDEPFNGVLDGAKRKTKAEMADKRQHFTAEQISRLLVGVQQARRLGRRQELTALIWLGMWTGCRIEELCVLRIEDVVEDRLRITEAKTEAGLREIPLHSRLKPLVQTLKERSKDGFLLSGLKFNLHGDRSHDIGKQFGRVKTALGFGPQHVFHSLRKTLATALRDARVEEVVAADILGHEIRTMSYGVYAGSVDFNLKREAIEKVHYSVDTPAFT